MKHLRVLESAGLIATRKEGRRTLHFLNPVPIQAVTDRWISRFAQPWAAHLLDIKLSVEKTMQQHSELQTHVFQVVIFAPIQKVWDALIDPEQTEKYYFGTRLETTLEIGSPFRYIGAEGRLIIDGEILECRPPHRLVAAFVPKWQGSEGFPSTKTTYELEEEKPGETTLTLTHSGLPAEHPTTKDTWHGWSRLLSNLKTLMEAPELLR